jgi:predicted nucleotidyltransferase
MGQVKVAYPTLSRAELLSHLRKASAKLQRSLPITRVVLFGSYATNRHTAASDIDLIVVYKDPPKEDAYKIVVNELQLPRLEPRVYTENQYNALMKQSPKFAGTLATEGISILEEAEPRG